MGAIMEELAREMADKVAVAKFNTDVDRKVPERLQVMSLPTTLIYRKGKLEDRIVGAVPKKALVGRIQGPGSP
jgi:thioredoxin-like negative regulator of GroEL